MSNISQFLANPARQLRYVLTGVGAASSTATWTAPSSIAVNEVLVVCVGGGGAGGAGALSPTPGAPFGQPSTIQTPAGGGGGGSGGAVGYFYPVTSGTTLSLTAGGTGGTSSANNPGPSPIPISATGGSAGSNGGNGQSGGGSGGSGGTVTSPLPAQSNNIFLIGGIPGSSGTPGGNVNQGSPVVYSIISGGAGGFGGSLQNIFPFFQIRQSSGTSLGGGAAQVSVSAWTPSPSVGTNSAIAGIGGRTPATNGSIGGGGGGGTGADPNYNVPAQTGPMPGAPGSVGAVFILY